MTKIYLIRHAESIANTQGIYQGQTYDTGLSPLGQKQAAALANRFSDIRLDAVFTSPLKRALQTAQALGEVAIDNNLVETNHGAWEGLSKDGIVTRWPDLYSRWLIQPATVEFPHGERFTHTVDRVMTWLEDISQKTGTFAAVTHSNIIMVILAKLTKLDVNAMWQFSMQPTAVTLIETHSPAKIIYLNDTSHLVDLASDLSKQAL